MPKMLKLSSRRPQICPKTLTSSSGNWFVAVTGIQRDIRGCQSLHRVADRRRQETHLRRLWDILKDEVAIGDCAIAEWSKTIAEKDMW